MHRFTRVLVRSLLALAALSGCTFNVQSFERDVTSVSTEPLSRLRFAAVDAGVPIEGTIEVRGQMRTAATLHLAGLLGASEDPGAVADRVDVQWQSGGDPVVELLVDYDGPAAENVYVDGMSIELPSTTDLDFTVGSTSVDVAGLESQLVAITSDSGSMRIRGGVREVLLESSSGSIDVEAEHGSVRTASGSIRARLTGPMRAHAESGSIEGSFGGHAEAIASSGSIELELLGALDDDVLIGADSGSVTLVVPRGAAMNVELTSDSGAVRVDGADVSYSGDRQWSGALNGGGAFTVRLQADSGSVTLIEQDS